MSWNPLTQARDYVLLAGQKTPGYAEIVGAGSVRNWDERKGYGMTGAISIFTGRGLAKFTIRLRLYTEADWQGWNELKPLIERMPKRRYGEGKDSGALDIWHPTLEGLDIRAVGIVKLAAPEQTGDGEWTISIDVIEFRRPKIALAKPDGPESPTPLDDIEEKWIKPLTQQVDRLLGNE
jgi:hypothetical protein